MISLMSHKLRPIGSPITLVYPIHNIGTYMSDMSIRHTRQTYTTAVKPTT